MMPHLIFLLPSDLKGHNIAQRIERHLEGFAGPLDISDVGVDET
jgi:hypothetical protein